MDALCALSECNEDDEVRRDVECAEPIAVVLVEALQIGLKGCSSPDEVVDEDRELRQLRDARHPDPTDPVPDFDSLWARGARG